MKALLAKEFLTRLRSRGFLVTLWLYLAGIGLIYLMTAVSNGYTLTWKLSRTLFHVLVHGQAVLLTFIAMIYASFSITEERGRRTFDSLFTSTLSPWQIVAGKALALILTLTLLLVAAMPIAALSFFYGNLSIPEFFSVHLYLLAYTSALVGMGIWISSVYHRTFAAVGAAIFFVLATLIGTAIVGFFSGIEKLFNVFVGITHITSGVMLHFGKWTYSPLGIGCLLWFMVFTLSVVRARQKFEGEKIRRPWRWQVIALALFLLLTWGDFGQYFTPLTFAPEPSQVTGQTPSGSDHVLTPIIHHRGILDAFVKFYVFQLTWLILWVLILGEDSRKPWISPWPAAGLGIGLAGVSLIATLMPPIAGQPEVWTGIQAVYLANGVYLLALLLVAAIARTKFDTTVVANAIVGAFVFISFFVPNFLVHMKTVSYANASFFIPAAIQYKETYLHPLVGYGLLSACLAFLLVWIRSDQAKQSGQG